MLLILKKDEIHVTPDSVPTSEDMEILRYYYYIHNGVDTVHVASIDEKWLSNISALVPSKLKKWPDIIGVMVDELKEDYLLCIKKSIVDFVLQDPALNELGITVYDSDHRREMKRICKGFTPLYEPTKVKLSNNLFIVNACITQVLDLWHRQFL